jgi:hypothetical protein
MYETRNAEVDYVARKVVGKASYLNLVTPWENMDTELVKREA